MHHMDDKIERLGGLRRRKMGGMNITLLRAKKGDSTGRERVAVVVD